MIKDIIYIKRKASNNNLPKELFIDSHEKIGASFTKTGEINSGLSLKEKKELLPSLLGTNDTDPQFYMKVNEFFANLSINVPQSENVELNISMDGDLPVSPLDYIKYKFALVNPKVSSTPETLSGCKFILENPRVLMDAKKDSLVKKKGAYKEFIKLSSSESKMKQVLVNAGLFISTLNPSEYELTLEEWVTANPNEFMAIISDSHMETKYFINSCISAEVLRKIGTVILNGDQTLGNTMEEAVLFVEDKSNSDVYATLKARLAEFEKK